MSDNVIPYGAGLLALLIFGIGQGITWITHPFLLLAAITAGVLLFGAKRHSLGGAGAAVATHRAPSSHALRNADHEAAHAGIAHGCGVPKSSIWVRETGAGIYCGPGPAAWNLHGAQRIAFYLADQTRVHDSGQYSRDGWEIQKELAKHPQREHALLMRRARSIAAQHRHSAFAQKVAQRIRETGGFG